MDLNNVLKLTFSAPLEKHPFDSLILKEDSLLVKPVYSMPDSSGRTIELQYKWAENKNYSLFIPDSSFEDIYGSYNDSTLIRFKTPSLDDYGTLIMNYTGDSTGTQYIVQLMNDNEVVLRQDTITDSRVIRYDYLKAQKFKLKAIADKNRNGRWDTGDYRKQILPERVFYFPSEISVRANWEIQEEWKLQ
jgi:hypothetical protein